MRRHVHALVRVVARERGQVLELVEGAGQALLGAVVAWGETQYSEKQKEEDIRLRKQT